jgi:HlyD family type I secretion membrane fusion protein
MLNTNPRPYIISGIVIIVLFFGGILAWSAFLPFYGAVIAPGIVKVSGNKKIVQHLEGGIVDEVLVRDGDAVKKGQVLIKLKSEKIDANIDLLQGKLNFKLAELARLRAESVMARSINWPEELIARKDDPGVVSVIKEELEIFNSRRKDLLNKISLYESQIIQLGKQKKGIEAQLKAQENILLALKDELASKEDLFRDNYIDKPQILELKRKVAEVEGRKESLAQSIAQIEQKIEEFNLRILDIKNSYKENSISELRKVTDEIFSLREQLRPLLDAKKRLEIVAPITGVVLNLRVHSEDSRVIKPGEPLMEIVPENSEMIIEARIRPNEITRVYKNQKARVQLSAFDRRSTPPVPGTVIYVSADQITTSTSGGVQSFYVAHVKVDEAELKKVGAYLYPGMPAVCYLTTKKRTILGYLLEPLLKMADQALRES